MTSKPIRVGIAGENNLDPLDIYFTHSKIRPFFSGCGKRIVDTIAEIESGQITAEDLPHISVIQDTEGHYFCLNNRRLYVLKHLRRRGFLKNNTVTVRVKKAIPRELAKYSTEKCSLNCTLIREKAAWNMDKEKEQNEEENDEEENDDTTAEDTIPPPAVIEKRIKYDKKDNQKNNSEETDEERFLRQKRKIAEAKALYEKQAAERRQKKAEKEALLRESGAAEKSDSDSDDDDMDDQQDVFICDVCSKEFKSVEQIEQHFQSRNHKKLVQEAYKRKQEAERRKAKNAANKQKKLAKAAQALALESGGEQEKSGGDVTVAGITLSSLPSPPPSASETNVTDMSVEKTKEEEEEEEEGSEKDESDDTESSDEEDDDYLLLKMASSTKRSQQGLPDMGSESEDGDSD